MRFKQILVLVLSFLLLCSLPTTLTLNVSAEDSHAAQIVASNRLTIENVTYTHREGQMGSNANSVGSIVLDMQVTGPGNVQDVLIGGWTDIVPSGDWIEAKITGIVSIWKNSLGWTPNSVPPLP